ncbi:MAG: hypothetical protein ACQEWE_16075 [Bacillota bacterium]
MLKSFEIRLRPLLYAFLAFTALYSMINDYIAGKGMLSFLIYLLIGTISVPVGNGLDTHTKNLYSQIILKRQSDHKELRRVDRIVKGGGVVLLYFYVQMGIIFVFFPGFLEVEFLGGPVYLAVVGANCYLIVVTYKQHIWEHAIV